jgi:hypothetical protein
MSSVGNEVAAVDSRSDIKPQSTLLTEDKISTEREVGVSASVWGGEWGNRVLEMKKLKRA